VRFRRLLVPLLILLTTAVSFPVRGQDADTNTIDDAAQTYANIVRATYLDSHDAAKDLLRVVREFVDAPTQAGLESAKAAWNTAREPYLQSEVFRFSGGPIDDEDGPEPFLNAWPLDEGFIDYVEGFPKQGIVNQSDLYPAITKEVLVELNEKEGETMISTGYHAIEFLLWGQDLSEDGPGARPMTDYTTHPNAARRKAYLVVCCELLVEHLEGLVKEWQSDIDGNYRSQFLADRKRSLWQVVAGARQFAGVEFGSDRLLVAWDTQLQEEEHSCFSDTTHRDVIFDAQGLENVLMGRYDFQGPINRRLVGIGLIALAKDFDSALAVSIEASLATVTEAAESIPVPFDQAILGEDDAPGRVAIFATVTALEHLAGQLAKLEAALAAELKR